MGTATANYLKECKKVFQKWGHEDTLIGDTERVVLKHQGLLNDWDLVQILRQNITVSQKQAKLKDQVSINATRHGAEALFRMRGGAFPVVFLRCGAESHAVCGGELQWVMA